MTEGRTIAFELAKPTLLLNQVLRMHWSKRSRYQRALSWSVRMAIGSQVPATPFLRARLRIERHSVGLPDEDGAIGGYKSLIDCLLPPGKPFLRKMKWVLPHPCGLSIIADDNPGCLVADYPPPVRVGSKRDQKTVVLITELPSNC